MIYVKADDALLQKAIIFASSAMKNCHNAKPVLTHSLRVAFSLYHFHYDILLVITAVLHDLLEDTEVIKEDIAAEFGEEVATLVSSLTMDKNIKDYQEQYIENFARLQTTPKALIIRCADIIDNISYIQLASHDIQKKVKEKCLYFYQQNKEQLQGEFIWQEFANLIASLA